ncbi:MAG: single-stranded-DNA-specific exonuclease RecJ [Candidatus Marinimicrobia bacterium]|nr:single-stranded-DNA-specific exonuclease RecJ [Candidatus Neomarinimicrobiota bacterium]
MKWVYPDISGDDVLEFSEQFRLSYLYTSILLNRNIRSKDALDQYFNKKLYSLYDPFLMQDMKLTADTLIEACKEKKKILVYGDYDVDGVTSASILYLFLKSMNESLYYYIPEREKDGYGVSPEGIEHAIDLGIDLIITCDCGITAHEQVDYAKKNGIDMIITDHHEQADTLPNALSILNPKRKDNSYPFRDLCGAGVVYKLVEAICQTLYGSTEKAEQYLDLVAIGTAADIVPLVDENRCFVREGLARIRRQECRVGILELFNVCQIDSRSITVINIVFGLAPRLNAVGRMGSASRAITLLTTDDRSTARQYSVILHQENEERQKVERKVTENALFQVKEKYGGNLPKAVVLAGDWHPGVIGIVSSKVKDKIHRPVFLIALKDGMGRGSGRSITGFDLYDALSNSADCLNGYGGHQMAAGLTIKKENIPVFEEQFIAYAEEHITDDMLISAIHVEADIKIEEINNQLMGFLHDMEPFGPENMRPKFSISNINVANANILKDKHLKFVIRENGYSLNCIGWNMLEQFELIMDPSQYVDMVFVPTINEWNGVKRIQLVIKDIRSHIS